MADIVNERPTPLARPEPVPIVSRRRFGAAYLLLAVIVGAAVGLIVVLATRDTTHRQVADTWSTWKPATTGTEGVREIARHVEPHLPDRQRPPAARRRRRADADPVHDPPRPGLGAPDQQQWSCCRIHRIAIRSGGPKKGAREPDYRTGGACNRPLDGWILAITILCGKTREANACCSRDFGGPLNLVPANGSELKKRLFR